jgi:hypothetical protein
VESKDLDDLNELLELMLLPLLIYAKGILIGFWFLIIGCLVACCRLKTNLDFFIVGELVSLSRELLWLFRMLLGGCIY